MVKFWSTLSLLTKNVKILAEVQKNGQKSQFFIKSRKPLVRIPPPFSRPGGKLTCFDEPLNFNRNFAMERKSQSPRTQP